MQQPLTIERVSGLEREAAGRWDVNAPYRLAELASGEDTAYHDLTDLIVAYVREHWASRDAKKLRVLDLGCGLGFLARSIASEGHEVIAIDSSDASIKLARDVHDQVSFYNTSLEAYARKLNRGEHFDVLVANMTLHCVLELPTFMTLASSLLATDGVFLATIPNPSSYLQRRDDIAVAGRNLMRELTLEVPFRIHAHTPHPAEVFFFHRPLRVYAASIRAAELKVSRYMVPQQLGEGKPQDVALFVLHHRATAS
jgi:2-polyprenyl-3-methyl-5-hydroxy-6-metoxy-1,4-benzoquinol methylase